MSTASTSDNQEPRTRTVLLTVDEAADYLAITKATIYTWRSRRLGYGPPAVKVGGCLRFKQSDLDAWINAHTEDHDNSFVGVDSARGKAPHPAGGIALTRRSTYGGA